jgi:hypothetical protein
MIPIRKLPEVLVFAALATFLLWVTSPKNIGDRSQYELYFRLIASLVVSGVIVRFAFKWLRQS